ncbi:MAG: hypothetical protein AB7E55_23765 [Pigmentiphaga sp.]
MPGDTAVKACRQSRGYWNGRVFVGTLDWRWIAIDARIWKPV